MSNFVFKFLNLEVTCIPNVIGKIVGDYYNNAHCNGATWIFFLWGILHLTFDKFMHSFLRRLRYKQHVCLTLTNSLWYLGFFSSALVYCGATLARNEVELFNFKKMHVPSENNIPTQVILGYTLISTFYMHTSFWMGIRMGSFVSFWKFLFLSLLCVFSYILRILEIAFTLTALISISEVSIELTRIIYTLSKRNNYFTNIFAGAMFLLTMLIFTALHVIVIPLTFVIPLGLKILSDYPNIILIFLFSCLMIWLILNIYKSVILNMFDHLLYHFKRAQNIGTKQCPGILMECSLFLPRDDDAFHLQTLRTEMKNREIEMISKRKPKNRSMILQTLKCMIAIKRKLSEKRMSESSESGDSEKSGENIKNDIASDITNSEDLSEGKECSDISSDQDSGENNDNFEESKDQNKYVIDNVQSLEKQEGLNQNLEISREDNEKTLSENESKTEVVNSDHLLSDSNNDDENVLLIRNNREDVIGDAYNRQNDKNISEEKHMECKANRK